MTTDPTKPLRPPAASPGTEPPCKPGCGTAWFVHDGGLQFGYCSVACHGAKRALHPVPDDMRATASALAENELLREAIANASRLAGEVFRLRAALRDAAPATSPVAGMPDGARCYEPGCAWRGTMGMLLRDPSGDVTHCPRCHSTAIVEHVKAPDPATYALPAPAAPAEPLPTTCDGSCAEDFGPMAPCKGHAASPSLVGEPGEMTLGEACAAPIGSVEFMLDECDGWRMFHPNGVFAACVLLAAKFRRKPAPQPQPAPQRSPRVAEMADEYLGELDPPGDTDETVKLFAEFGNRVLREFVAEAMDATKAAWGLSGDAPGGGRK